MLPSRGSVAALIVLRFLLLVAIGATATRPPNKADGIKKAHARRPQESNDIASHERAPATKALRCARANTVVGTSASTAFFPAMHALAESVWAAAHFPCVLVSTPSELKHSERIYPLPRPHPRPLPELMWCNASVRYRDLKDARHAYGWRRTGFYKVRLFRFVLDLGLDLLTLDLDWRMQFDPLPGIHAANVDVVAISDTLMGGKYLNIGNLWMRSSRTSRAFAAVVENRTFAAWDQQIFNEELNFNSAFAALSCCHSRCLACASVKDESAPKKDEDGLTRRRRLEGPDVCWQGEPLRALPPPLTSREPWRLSQTWRGDAYNGVPEGPERPIGRCNNMRNKCLHWVEGQCRHPSASRSAVVHAGA